MSQTLYPYIESVSVQPWQGDHAPQRMLLIRLGAMGDVFFTLPFASSIRSKYPTIKMDLLVRAEYAELPEALGIFDKVYRLDGGKSTFKHACYLAFLMPKLIANRYQIVADLQRNRLSQIARRALLPTTWCEFDRFSPISAIKRTQWSLEQLGLGSIPPVFDLTQRMETLPSSIALLENHGLLPSQPMIVLNPGGYFPSRHWPLERYAALAQLWVQKDPRVQFLILGDRRIKEKATQLTSLFPEKITNLTGHTTIREAYSIVCQSHFMLTEDSGLGHLAWLSGIKTLMLLGSTRADWTAPVGAHTACLHSSDLPCGNCMKPHCPFPENICLTRYSAQTVFEHAWKLSQLDLANY